MTYVYGATLKGTAEFVQDYIECEKGTPWPQDARADVYARYCAKKLFQGIAGAVPAAAEAMRWLREIAQQQPNGKRMEWATPTGFVVQHDYQGYDEVRIKLRSCGLTDVLIRNWNNDTQTIKMQNAISPNFVHALDASHITLTANAMQDAGLSMVGIHDSFGTHACDVPSMHKILREQFVQMYSRNMLGEFLWDVGATSELPQRGNLELSQVLDSEFFFS
jgi:DNA-directed RNA polymerase